MNTKATRTTYMITKTVQKIEELILRTTGLPRTVLHKKAIDFFFEKEEPRISPRLLIKDKNNPEYVMKDTIEPVYIEPADRERMKEVAKKFHTTMSVVFLEALMEYVTFQVETLGLMDKLKFQENKKSNY